MWAHRLALLSAVGGVESDAVDVAGELAEGFERRGGARNARSPT